MSIPLALVVLAPGAGAQCELDELTAGDAAAGDLFGISVSLSGDTALVGAWNDDDAGADSGSAYVFERQGALWVETKKLTASDAAAGDWFGSAVSLSGGTALVGAWHDDDGGEDSGSAYVFEKQGALWVETKKLTGSGAGPDDHFGVSVSLSGGTALVGANRHDGGGASSGSAWVFEKQGSAWVETAKLAASDGAADDWFGRAVALSGDRALVGASQGSHAAYVFEKQGALWVETEKLTASGPGPTNGFGYAVSLSGDRALVGAPGDDEAGPFSGSAFVFEKQGALWVETAKLTASDAAANDYFGVSVSLLGDTALVGAFNDDGPATSSGAAFVFEKQGALWVETARLIASAAAAGDYLGASVSLSGDTALVGAAGSGSASGSAHVFRLGPCLGEPTPGLVAAVNTVTVSDATPGGLVAVGFSLATGSTPVGSLCPGLTVELDNPTLVALLTADGKGSAGFGGFVPASFGGTTVFLQGADLAACEATNLVAHTFP